MLGSTFEGKGGFYLGKQAEIKNMIYV